MKYIFISLLLLAACAKAQKADIFDDFDSASDVAKTGTDEFAEFDNNTREPAANSDVLEELSNVDHEMSDAAEPIESSNSSVPYEKPARESTRARDSFYTVQVGAYPTKRSAKVEASKLGIKLSEVSYQRADVNGKTWHRVLVGKFRYKSAALQMQKKIPVESIVRSIRSEDAGLWH